MPEEEFQLDPQEPEEAPAGRAGMGGHQASRMESDEYLTDPKLLEKLGAFDLDPCSPIVRPWNTAKKHYTILDNGLRKEWEGRVWCNPPYGREIGKWMGRMAEHMHGTALIFARTDTTVWRQHVWAEGTAVLFVYGRIYFYTVTGERCEANGGAPSAFIAYGREDADILKRSGIPGFFVDLELCRK